MSRTGGLSLALLLCAVAPSAAATLQEAAARVVEDSSRGMPLVTHVTVVLVDNTHQPILKVPAGIGNGQDPKTNLYWGALYGVRTYLPRHAGWSVLPVTRPADPHVLERALFHKQVETSGGKSVDAYVLADAWDGARMVEGLDHYLKMAAGHVSDSFVIRDGTATRTVAAGSASHVVAFVGHDGLMDNPVPELLKPKPGARPRASIVLACTSLEYFGPPLRKCGAPFLCLTTGYMAPEAYTLAAAVETWFATADPKKTRESAAQAYHQYQKCGLTGARRLFAGD